MVLQSFVRFTRHGIGRACLVFLKQEIFKFSYPIMVPSVICDIHTTWDRYGMLSFLETRDFQVFISSNGSSVICEIHTTWDR